MDIVEIAPSALPRRRVLLKSYFSPACVVLVLYPKQNDRSIFDSARSLTKTTVFCPLCKVSCCLTMRDKILLSCMVSVPSMITAEGESSRGDIARIHRMFKWNRRVTASMNPKIAVTGEHQADNFI